MIESPLQIIERIAKDSDRSLAVVFFLFFARFEYVLKRAGWVTVGPEAKADWDKYGRQHADLLTRNTEVRFQNAVAYLKQRPPEKQIVGSSGLAWASDQYSAAFDLARVLTLVCRIRNNLFHGGKFSSGPVPDASRDKDLLEAALIVMQGCLDFEAQLSADFIMDL